MARPVRPWFRVYVEMFPDRKIRRLRPAQRWVWVAIMGAARESPEPGKLFVAPGLPMSMDELADYAGVTRREAHAAVSAMAAMSMVTCDNGLIAVTNWDSRQFESDDTTARTRAHRERSSPPPMERSKERSNPVHRNAPERTRAFATETETETETEEHPSDVQAKPPASPRASAPPAKPKPPPRRATQRPADFRPNQGHVDLAAELGIDLRTEWAQFCDHHDAKGTTFKDWPAALRTWIRNAAKYRRPAPRSVGGQPSNAERHLALINQLAANEHQDGPR